MEHLAQVQSTWEDVAAKLRHTSVCWHGNPVSDQDRRTFADAILLSSLALTDLSQRFVGVGTEREIIAWARFACTLDVALLGSFLSDAVKLLRHVAKPTTYSWFKRQLAGYTFTGAFLAPIRMVLTSFLEEPSWQDFYVCYQFLSILTHVTLRDINVDVEPGYEELESYLHSMPHPESIVMELNSIMREWMADFSITEASFIPRHGPGAIAEKASRQVPLQKYRYLGSTAMLRYVFLHHAGIDVDTYFPLAPYKWESKSVIVSVPKSLEKRRVISKEPATLQYLQQGVSRCVVDYIHHSPALRGHIDLEHQEISADLAIQSSGDHRFATIDLSSASDTVTTRLVKAVFRGTPLYPYLVALRSKTTVLPSGKVIELAKYAPSGSALCFPVETLIFASIVEFTVRRAQRTNLGLYPRWRVYGDDIIVQEPLFWDTLLTLEGLGFKPNHSKSFCSDSRFRESCGGEGYDGVDVRPLRIPRGFTALGTRLTSHHAATYMGLVDLANMAEAHNMPLLRATVIRSLLHNEVAAPLFSATGYGALYSPWPDNYRAAHRTNFRLQRAEIQVAMAVSPRPGRPEIGDDDLQDARYFETLRQTLNRSGDMFEPEHRVSVPSSSARPKLKKKWVVRPTLS